VADSPFTFLHGTDLHVNRLHIKERLQRVGWLTSATISAFTQVASSIFR
jgi:hypothetical protein